MGGGNSGEYTSLGGGVKPLKAFEIYKFFSFNLLPIYYIYLPLTKSFHCICSYMYICIYFFFVKLSNEINQKIEKCSVFTFINHEEKINGER